MMANKERGKDILVIIAYIITFSLIFLKGILTFDYLLISKNILISIPGFLYGILPLAKKLNTL